MHQVKYDIVGDIHGHADRFVELITQLGYRPVDGVWQHPERILLSVGDIIDRGPGQKEVVDILRPMQENNKAIVLMGNHEFYAIAWYLKDNEGQPLRPHSDKNRAEHEAFLDQAQEGSQWYIDTIHWLKTLPLFYQTEQLRCVHAAWDNQYIKELQAYTNDKGVLMPELWSKLARLDRRFFKALDYSLNGSKLNLPEGTSFVDSGGRRRTKARLKWWDVPDANATFRNSCTSVPDLTELPDTPIALSLVPDIAGATPIFFGHYWMQGTPALMKENIACLDWSVVVNQGVLAAYRFDGEQVLSQNKLVWV